MGLKQFVSSRLERVKMSNSPTSNDCDLTKTGGCLREVPFHRGCIWSNPPNYVFWKVREFWHTLDVQDVWDHHGLSSTCPNHVSATVRQWCAKVPDMICVLAWVPSFHFWLGFVLKVSKLLQIKPVFLITPVFQKGFPPRVSCDVPWTVLHLRVVRPLVASLLAAGGLPQSWS